MSAEPVLSAAGLHRRFDRQEDLFDRIGRRLRGGSPRRAVHALNGIDLTLNVGEVVGVVGESGCGKSTLGQILVGLQPPTSGSVRYRGRPVMRGLNPEHLKLQMIFQDSGATLNPRMTVLDLIGEGAVANRLVRRRDLRDFVAERLELVGLGADALGRYAHQFSGGQRQRLNIARALALDPDTLVCDEPVAALDVSTQAQILNLFTDLRSRLGLTYLFISHDLGVVRQVTTRLVIMYLGRIVEEGATADIFANPWHPYTAALIENVPRLSRRAQRFRPVQGEVPSPTDMPAGCAFRSRCPIAEAACGEAVPMLTGAPGGHRHACLVRAREGVRP